MDVGSDHSAVSSYLLAAFDSKVMSVSHDDAMDRFPCLWIDALNVTVQARLAWVLVLIESAEPAIRSVISEFESESFETSSIRVIQNCCPQDLVSTQSDTAYRGAATPHKICMNEDCTLWVRIKHFAHFLQLLKMQMLR
jgi:hypothetical protein